MEIQKQTLTKGRLFKLFTDFGPYFRHLKSTENSYFFDCLELCVDPTMEFETREFLGWWVVIEKQGTTYVYQQHYGKFNQLHQWEKSALTKEDQKNLETSFKLFIENLTELFVENIFTLENQGELKAK